MFFNSLFRTRLSFGRHTWRQNRFEISKLSAIYNYFLGSMFKNGFQRVKPVGLSGDYYFLNYVERREKQSRRTVANNRNVISRRLSTAATNKMDSKCNSNRKNDIIKMFTFHAISNERLARKPQSTLERTITVNLRKNNFNRKIL